MTASSFNTFIIFTIHLNFILCSNHGFEVMQPQNQTVNSDGLASISCEHTANITSVEDVQLRAIPLETILCQKGMENCKNIIMHQENLNKFLFIMLNIGPEAMNMKYQCEFTVKIDDLYYTKTGTPTILLPGQKEGVSTSSPCPPCPSFPPSPQPQDHQLRWVMTGLLALMFIYSCIMTSFYIRLRVRNNDPENSTYVVMRKAPL